MQQNNKILVGLVLIIAVLAIFFYFIPAFGGKIEIKPFVDLGAVIVRWYGLIMAGSILTGYFVARKYSWRFGIDKREIDNITFWLAVVGILGARLYYIIFAFDYFLEHPNEIYKIWHGGLSIYGALITGLVYIIFYSRNKAYTKYQLLDLVALSLPLAQALGRFGNFFNQEAYGNVTNLPWKMYVSSDRQYHHPTFLYESIASVLIFFLLSRMLGKVKTGVITFTYLGLYSLARFFIEPMRVDSVFVAGFRADQVIAFVFVVIAALGFLGLVAVEKRA